MERVEFFGAAVFVPVFVVSIGLLLDPSVMFTAETLGLAAIVCAAALGGKAAACWLAGRILGFTRPEKAAMYVLTARRRVLKWLPARAGHRPPLGAKVLVIAPVGGPSEAAVRAATRLARPDGGHSDVLITCTPQDGRPDNATLRAVEHRLSRHGLDGHVRTDASDVGDALARSLLTAEPSVVVVDDPPYVALPGDVPVLVVDGARAPRVIAADNDGVAEEIARRLR
jgi:hypothetical protein